VNVTIFPRTAEKKFSTSFDDRQRKRRQLEVAGPTIATSRANAAVVIWIAVAVGEEARIKNTSCIINYFVLLEVQEEKINCIISDSHL
jgi:hypothetical protein